MRIVPQPAESSDNTDNTSAHNKQTLPSGCNLKQDTVISILTNAEPLQHIPPGTKENCYFLVDNKRNKIRRDHSEFPDDCGAWATGAPSSQTHLLARQHGFSMVIKRANLFCTRRQINKKMTFIPIEPQPDIKYNFNNTQNLQ